MWEIYSRKSPFEGENVRKVLRDVCDRRRNKRPEIAKTFPPKMVQVRTQVLFAGSNAIFKKRCVRTLTTVLI